MDATQAMSVSWTAGKTDIYNSLLSRSSRVLKNLNFGIISNLKTTNKIQGVPSHMDMPSAHASPQFPEPAK